MSDDLREIIKEGDMVYDGSNWGFATSSPGNAWVWIVYPGREEGSSLPLTMVTEVRRVPTIWRKP